MRVPPITIKRRTRHFMPHAPLPRLFSYDLTRSQAYRLKAWIDKVIAKNESEGWK